MESRRARMGNCVVDSRRCTLTCSDTSVWGWARHNVTCWSIGWIKHNVACWRTIRADMNTVMLVQDTQWRSDDVCASTKFPDYLALLPPLLGALKHNAIADTLWLQRMSTFVVILFNSDMALAASVQINVVARFGQGRYKRARHSGKHNLSWAFTNVLTGCVAQF